MKRMKFWQKLLLGTLFTFYAAEGEAGGAAEGEGEGQQEEQKKEPSAQDQKKEESKKPSDEEARLLKENMKRKEELKKAAEENAALQEKLKQFEGIDVESVKKLLSDQKEAETKHLEAKGDWERLKARMAEEHDKEIKALKDQLSDANDKLTKATGSINELSIGTKFGQSQFISDELTLTSAKARVIYGDHFDLENGEVVGYDKPRGAANRTAIVDQYGSPVGFDAALRKIIEADPEKDHLLKSKVKSGAGSESKKSTGVQSQESQPQDSVSKIAAGLKGLKIGV